MVLMFRDSQGNSNLANRLGFGHAYTEGRDELGWLKHMYEGARARAQALGFEPPEFQDFWEAGACEFPSPPESRILLGEFRRDPVRHPLATPSGRIEIFFEHHRRLPLCRLPAASDVAGGRRVAGLGCDVAFSSASAVELADTTTSQPA